jgi:ABC-type dipeptide/oligopeptide/nickel transport system permease subunit
MSTTVAVERSLRFRRPRVTKALRRPLGVVGATVVVGWLLIAVIAPLIAPSDPLATGTVLFQAPSSAHIFGTDELGRDVFTRVLYGSRVTLPLSILLVALSLVIGSLLGAIAGYVGGWVDGLIMRITDLVFAFPAIVLAMVVTATLGPSLRNAVIALVIVQWPSYARVVRGQVLSTRDADYVNASRLLGASSRRALFVDVMPNVFGPVVVYAAVDLGNAVLLLSGLSFLGLGAQPPTAEWGSMVSTGTQYFQNWWMSTFPGLAIFSIVLAFNFLGDSLRDALDPRQVSVREPKP